MRRGEEELVDRVMHGLDPEAFEHAFADGSKLSRREAVALVASSERD